MRISYLIILIVIAIVLGLSVAIGLGVRKNTYNINLPANQPTDNK